MGKKPAPTEAWKDPAFDDWDLKIDPDEFVVPAQDEKGHSAREWIRIQPALEADIDQMLAAKVFPYRTKADLIRHGIYRHIRWLHRVKEGMPKHLFIAFEAILEILRNEEINQANEHVFERLRTVMENYLAHGDNGEARRTMAIIREKLRGVQDSSWKKRFIKKLERSHAEPPKAAQTTD